MEFLLFGAARINGKARSAVDIGERKRHRIRLGLCIPQTMLDRHRAVRLKLNGSWQWWNMVSFRTKENLRWFVLLKFRDYAEIDFF